MVRAGRRRTSSWRRQIARLMAIAVIACGTLAAPPLAAAAAAPTFVADAAAVDVPETVAGRLTGTFSDPDGDEVVLSASEGRIQKDWPQWGQWEWTGPPRDGPSESEVTLTATDATGASTTLSFPYRVTNVAPDTWSMGPAFVPVGSKSSRFFKWSAQDVPLDTLTNTVDCGSGTVESIGDTIINTVKSVRCFFPSAGRYVVGVRSSDDDGGSSDGRITTVATTRVTSVADGRLVVDDPSAAGLGGVLTTADVNGDGRADIVIGCDAAGSPFPDLGYVSVILGRSTLGLVDPDAIPPGAGFRLIGSVGTDLRHVASAGDVNHDGLDDLVIGASEAAGSKGVAYVVFGSRSTADVDLASMPSSRGFRITGGDAYRAGAAVAGLGDVNGDGFDDVGVGAPFVGTPDSDGAAFVILGRASPTSIDLTAMPAGRGYRIDTPGQQTGSSIAGGDVNGDGKSDIIVGSAWGWYSSVVVIYGRTATTNVDANTLPSSVGFQIGGGEGLSVGSVAAGDMNGDGYAEVAFTHAAANNALAWGISIVHGAKTNASIPYLATRSPRLTRVKIDDGADELAMFDHNGDGRSDLVIGAPSSENNGERSGSVYVINGTAALADIDTDVLDSRWSRIDGDVSDALAGDGVAGGDVTGDGVSDLIIGAPNTTVPGGDLRARISLIAGVKADVTRPVVSAPTQQIPVVSTTVAGRPLVRISWSGSDTGSGIARYVASQSTDAGAWVTLTGVTSSTHVDVRVATGHTYRFRVRAIDKVGNVSVWEYGPTFHVDAYAESNTHIRYVGSWGTSASSTYVGGATRFASRGGATATLTFTGRSLAWVAPTGPSRGIALVYVNGALIGSYSLNAVSTHPSHVIASWRWSTSAVRTVVIKVAGTTGHPRIDVDAFYGLR